MSSSLVGSSWSDRLRYFYNIAPTPADSRHSHLMPHNGKVARQVLNPADQSRLERRYPSSRIPRWAWIAAAVVVVPALLAAWMWIASSQALQDVVGSVHTFEVFDDRVEGVINVRRADPSRSASCEVFAQAVNFERVGEIDVQVPPGTAEEEFVSVSLKTYRRATALDVGKCVLTPTAPNR